MPIDSLPSQAFDGQLYVDAFRVEWKFDGSASCWRKIGQRPDIPPASEVQSGLLTARLKQLLDSIPAGGGHFGIVAQPLLSLVPQNPNILHKGQIASIALTESGTKIDGEVERSYTPEQFVGKILIFKTGTLIKNAFLIFTNDETSIFIEGDATEAKTGDKFEIVESADLNPSGILLGDIMLVSDSIDITCVDGEGLPLINNNQCNLDIIQCDNVENPPGLNFQINQDFFDSLCVIVPGCKGPAGTRGGPGSTGLDGTGDGPQGEQGDPGENAPAIGDTFTGIKIIDVDDIFDTAVVSMELDAANGKLNIVRAKVRTPDSSTPATQLISTPVNRAVVFKDSTSFEYDIMKPSVDPVDNVDVDILKYPRGYAKAESGSTRATTVSKIKLSEVIDAVISHYEEKLQLINDAYNQELKTYIEGKDEAARSILTELAQKVAECEFELPIDFCLGISPSDCHQSALSTGQVPFDFALADTLLALPTDDESVTGTSLGVYSVPATISPDSVEAKQATIVVDVDSPFLAIEGEQAASQSGDTFVPVLHPNNTTSTNTTTLPAGFYVVKIKPENSAIRSSETNGWIINSDEPGVGLEVVAQSGNNPSIVISGSPPSVDFNPLEKSSVERAYEVADFTEQVVSVELTEPGSMSLCAFVPGTAPQGAINVEVLRLQTPEGTALLL